MSMSLWWTQRDQLDDEQVRLIEDLSLKEDFLVCGPPGSGKTNVLLRRAQFVRSQDMPNVLVLTYTRPLVEFVKTGCSDAEGREIFPSSCVDTLESWLRDLYKKHETPLPEEPQGQDTHRLWKEALASGALSFIKAKRMPKYDALFVDEVQDLYDVEIKLLRQWSDVLFFVGDARQKIFGGTGLPAAQRLIRAENQFNLPFHYRIAPALCKMADKILNATGVDSLSATSHYKGPKPGTVDVHGPLQKKAQLVDCAQKLKDQIRVYGDFIKQGDRIGIVVARRADRDVVLEYLEQDAELAGKAKIIRAKDGTAEDSDYDPSFDLGCPINILTLKGCKGIEFRAVHWLFCEQLSHYNSPEHYYTLVTRAKTSLDLYFDGQLPQDLARSHSQQGRSLWA
jgi:superfamily I DNA/RNA helicase